MAIFKIDIEKQLGAEFWTNVYYVNTTDIVLANTNAGVFADAERQFHRENVIITKYRTSDMTINNDQFISTPYNQAGLLGGTDETLPLFNVIRVDLGVVGFGRPSRKFYRLPLGEQSQANGILSTQIKDIVKTELEGVLFNVGGTWSDESGNQIETINIYPFVGMRQLRRGSKRRSSPII